ncbi:hypothetical protein E8E14_014501 [Neopestalotiopsis sp. 37M]|nr:hypothetical protein E8E14_014501 [Neopestalotiopsis sp. 37M]
MGATLTLKRQEADFLIALTAFFVAFVGVRFWRIICFALHRIFSTANPKDVVYHQRQAILRNSSAPEGDIELLLRLFWKNRYSRQGLKLLSTALFACTCLIAFVAAGALSSRISTGVGDEVLIKSERCGFYYSSNPEVNSDRYLSLAYAAEVLDQAANYAQKCYLNGSFGLDCNLWVRSRLPGTVDYKATSYSQNADFKPIDELVRTDADVILTFLSGNGVLNMNPLTGDWYRTADEPFTVFGAGATEEGAFNVYLPSEPASPMGCVNQYQFCSTEYPGTTGCGPLESLRGALAGVAPFFNTSYPEFLTFVESGNASSTQTARFDYFATVFFGVGNSLDQILKQIGSSGLLSQRSILGGQQALLPPNQWQLDMRYLWDTSLAAVQAGVVQHVYGPTDAATLQSWLKFTGPEMEKLCSSQKVRSTAHGSFSLFGLSFIFVGGSIIILISYLLEPVSSFLHNRWGYKKYSHLEWTSNSMLHLQRQRMAHEEASLGTWPKSVETLQAKTPSDMLNCLDVTDASRPILRSIKKAEKVRSARTSVEAPEADISDVSASSLCETFNTLPMSVLDRSSFHAEERVTSPRGTWGSFTTKASRSNTDPSARTEWYLDDGESSLYSQRVSFQESQAPQIVTQFDFERDVPPRGYIANYL